MANTMSRTEEPAELILNLRADGSINVDGAILAPSQLAPLLTGELAKAGQTGLDLRVVVRADRQGRFDRLNEVLKTCRGCGLSQVVFRAREAGAP